MHKFKNLLVIIDDDSNNFLSSPTTFNLLLSHDHVLGCKRLNIFIVMQKES